MLGFDDIAGGVLSIGGKLIDRLWPDPLERDKAKIALMEMQQRGELAELNADLQLAVEQAKINQVEAQSDSLFVAGWRPFIGWVCGVALAWNFIGSPLMKFFYPNQPLPSVDASMLIGLVMAMLGVGGMRTFEKIKGVASK